MTLEFGPILRAMRRNKVRFGLIVLEIALTLAVVANCLTMIVDARTRMGKESGFDDDNLISVRSVPFDTAFREDGYLDNSLRQDLLALRALPGVRYASATRFLPWQGGGSSSEFRVAGSQGQMLRSQSYSVDEHILDTLGVQVVAGRAFTHEDWERDTARLRALIGTQRELGTDGKPKQKFSQDVLLSRAFATLLFGDAPAAGRMIEDTDGDLYPVIGVFDKFYNPYGWPIHEYAMLYATAARSYEGGAHYLVRTEAGQRPLVVAAIEQRLKAENAGRTITVRTLDEVKGVFFLSQQVVVTAMGAVAVLLILVTSLGIVGLTSFSVTERTRQIGTRRALGARRVDVLRHFLLENWLVTSMGLTLGTVFAYSLNFALAGVGNGVKLSPGLLASGMLLLWIVGLLATLAPALRAARISPAIATRNV
jgi:putative ABC transport system permease protein